MKYAPPRWVSDGERALIPWPTPEKPRQGAWVTIAVAAGNHCRVVNAELGVDRWLRTDALLVPIDDPRAFGYVPPDMTSQRRSEESK